MSDTTTARPGAIREVREDARGVSLIAEAGGLRIEAPADSVLRVRVLRSGQEPEPSWAVLPSDAAPESPKLRESEDCYTVTASGCAVHIRRADGVFRVETRDGRAVLDDAAVAWSGDGVRLTWSQPAERRVYACGENSGGLERRGQPMEFWNTDHYAFAVGAGPLYQSIPFALFMDGADAGGLFLDNTYRQRWDLGGDRAVIKAEGGAADLYLFTGDGPRAVVSAFTQLTGRAPLPPLWALGYHQSRYSYYPDAQVRDLAAEFRRRAIPCDAIYFDIHYMERYKDFTWDRTRFPDPKGLLQDLKRDGFQSVVILDPGVKIEDGYSVYEELKAAGFHVKMPGGEPYVGKVWPGDCLFPDFTNAACRAWWGGLYAGLIDDGVTGFWNDMNEPAIFETESRTMPPDARFSGDHGPGDHRRFHNIYGMQMARAGYEGVRRLRPDERAFFLSRAGYAGASRYAATWTGDNVASWEHLRLSLAMVMNLGLSGQPISGPDIGGFVGEPSAELFCRWLQAGALMPYCRVHSAKPDHDNPDAEAVTPREPWVFGPEWEDRHRAAIELRYRLMPTLYTLAEEAARTGLPMLRPLFMEFPDDPRCAGVEDQFMVGANLLCAPVLEDGARSRPVYLPDGPWYDFWTNDPVTGGQVISVEAPLERLPLYARGGAVLAVQPVVQHTGEMDAQPLELRFYLHDGSAGGEVYEDDGRSMNYDSGAFLRTRITVRTEGGDRRVEAFTEGDYESPRPEARHTFIGA
jgi:alpha-glucosidase